MAAAKFCDTCQWWSFTFKNGNSSVGTCENDLVTDKVKLSQDYDSMENDDPVIFTDSCFGCIFHEKKDSKVLFKIEIPPLKGGTKK